jgi:hypothetical protein
VAKSPRSTFLHAFRADGNISSICRCCFVMIAIEPNEIDLCKPESAHICADFSLGRLFHHDEVNHPEC